MEAPKKIYYAPYGDMRVNDQITENDIEYIRKDAFIEKAVNWLRCHPSSHYDDLEEFANAFKKAMKL